MTLRRGATALLLSAILVVTACGSGDDGAQPQAASSTAVGAVRIAAPPASANVHAWARPAVSGGRRGYVATFQSPAGPVRARLAGIGYPAQGDAAGTRYVGPGVAARWTGIAHGQYTVTVAHQGAWVGLQIWSRGGQWRAKVDGRYVDPKPRPVGSDSAVHTIGLDFSHAQPSKRRVVQFELRGGAWLSGIVAGAHDRLGLPPRASGPSVYWLGDSYFAGGGSRYPGFTDLVHRASARLGWGQVTVDALGGTGYVKDNAAAKFPNFLARARANIGRGRAQPDVVVVGGSINDAGEDLRTVSASARRLYAYLARAAPAAKVVVVVFSPRIPAPPNFAALDKAVLDAAAASPNVVGALDLASAVPRTAARVQGANGHPTQSGHDLYGRLIADFIRARIRR